MLTAFCMLLTGLILYVVVWECACVPKVMKVEEDFTGTRRRGAESSEPRVPSSGATNNHNGQSVAEPGVEDRGWG